MINVVIIPTSRGEQKKQFPIYKTICRGYTVLPTPGSTLYLLGQWLNFKLLGITYLVGKIKFKLLFQGPLAK